jgi:hypothetical protein
MRGISNGRSPNEATIATGAVKGEGEVGGGPQHRAERVPVRADVAGQADLGGSVQRLDGPRPLFLGAHLLGRHDREYLALPLPAAG